MVEVTPTHTPPAGSVKSDRPFIKPVDQCQSVIQPVIDRPQSVDRPAPSDLSGTNPPTLQQQEPSKLTSEMARKQSESDMATDSDI